MDKEKLNRLADALLDFVERTAKKATSETEVKALPEVAAVLIEIFKLQQSLAFRLRGRPYKSLQRIR